jgi:hypothetical protein
MSITVPAFSRNAYDTHCAVRCSFFEKIPTESLGFCANDPPRLNPRALTPPAAGGRAVTEAFAGQEWSGVGAGRPWLLVVLVARVMTSVWRDPLGRLARG